MVNAACRFNVNMIQLVDCHRCQDLLSAADNAATASCINGTCVIVCVCVHVHTIFLYEKSTGYMYLNLLCLS